MASDLGLHSLPLFLLWAAWHKWVKGIKSICISLIFLKDPCFIKVMYKKPGLITWLVAIQALNYALRIIIILQEQQRDRTYLLACAPREGSNAPAHPCSLISLHCPHEETLHLWIFKMSLVKSLIRLRECAG